MLDRGSWVSSFVAKVSKVCFFFLSKFFHLILIFKLRVKREKIETNSCQVNNDYFYYSKLKITSTIYTETLFNQLVLGIYK